MQRCNRPKHVSLDSGCWMRCIALCDSESIRSNRRRDFQAAAAVQSPVVGNTGGDGPRLLSVAADLHGSQHRRCDGQQSRQPVNNVICLSDDYRARPAGGWQRATAQSPIGYFYVVCFRHPAVASRRRSLRQKVISTYISIVCKVCR